MCPLQFKWPDGNSNSRLRVGAVLGGGSKSPPPGTSLDSFTDLCPLLLWEWMYGKKEGKCRLFSYSCGVIELIHVMPYLAHIIEQMDCHIRVSTTHCRVVHMLVTNVIPVFMGI